MKDPSYFVILTTILILFNLGSQASSNSSQNNFLQCLLYNSEQSNPISEVIYIPNNSSFLSILQAYIKNRRFSTITTPKPLAIVAALHESHVQATIICAKQNHIQIRIRSGGHDYEGLSYVSYTPFVILDMFNIRSITVDAENGTVWVQTGATIGELYHKIAKETEGFGFPAGVFPTLGVGGHFGGGGYGNLMRKYGLAVDNIIDAKLVNVNGTILNRDSMGEDLFWAIRGGGAASFGVVLSWKIKLVPVPPKVTVFNVARTLEQGAANLLYQWQKVAHKLPEDVFVRVMIQVAKVSHGSDKKTVKASFICLFLGEAGSLLDIMKENFPLLGLQEKDCIQMSWIESTVFYAGYPNGTSVDVLVDRSGINAQNFFKSKSDYVKEPISGTDLESMWKMMLDAEKIVMLWNPYGGKMEEILESETPFPHRAGNLFQIWYFVSWNEEGNETAERHMNLMRTFYTAMTPYVSKSPREVYVNYRDLDIGSNPSNYTSFANGIVYGRKYFKGNVERLVRVKTRVDPDNFFRYEQSIPVVDAGVTNEAGPGSESIVPIKHDREPPPASIYSASVRFSPGSCSGLTFFLNFFFFIFVIAI